MTEQEKECNIESDKSEIIQYVDLDNVLDKNIAIKPKLKYSNEIFSIDSIIRETYGINIKCVK